MIKCKHQKRNKFGRRDYSLYLQNLDTELPPIHSGTTHREYVYHANTKARICDEMDERMDVLVRKNSTENFLHVEYLTVIAMTLPDVSCAGVACPLVSMKTLEGEFLPVTNQQQTQHFDA